MAKKTTQAGRIEALEDRLMHLENQVQCGVRGHRWEYGVAHLERCSALGHCNFIPCTCRMCDAKSSVEVDLDTRRGRKEAWRLLGYKPRRPRVPRL